MGSLIKDLLPSLVYFKCKNEKETNENVGAIKPQDGVLVPVDSHFDEKFKAIQDAHQEDDKKALTDARAKLARAFTIRQKCK